MNSVEQIASGYGNFSYARDNAANQAGNGTEFAKLIGDETEIRSSEQTSDRYHSDGEEKLLSIDNADRIVYNMWGIVQHTVLTRGQLMNIVT